MTSEQQMVLFTLLSFVTLGAGTIVLSLVTIFSRGPRALALIMASFQIFIGVNIALMLDQLGWVCVALGVLAFIIGLLPKRKPSATELEADD